MATTFATEQFEEPTKSLGDYLGALRRHKWQSVFISLTILILSLLLALLLPAIYRSSAVILIEQQEIPQDLVRSTVTSYASERIQVISQRVMTTGNLWGIIEKYGLYPDERESDPREAVVARMRGDIGSDTLSANVVDPRSGRAIKATIAFTVSYENRSPKLAQQVANELTTLYLRENLQTREQAAEETAAFLADEAQTLNQQITELEQQLADFKEANAGRLPELMDMNLSLMNRTESEIRQVENQILNLKERRIYLQAELAQITPSSTIYSEAGERVLSPAGRLRVLENEYRRLVTTYSQDHPDVKRVNREIEALRRETGLGPDPTEIAAQLSARRSDLTAARKEYGADHPDVRRLESQVELLEKQLAEAQSNGSSRNRIDQALIADNPAYIQLRTQLDAADTELVGLERKKQQLVAKLEDYERRLTETPEVEREYRALVRDYESTVAKHRDVKAKQMTAQLARSLESEQKGEKFTLIEPPLLPGKPVRPNRMAIGTLGLLLAIAAGVGWALLRDATDKSVRGKSGVQAVSGSAPLAFVPRIVTKAERRRARRTLQLSGAAAFVLVVGVLLTVHFAYGPLDTLWFIAMRKLGL